MVNKIKAKFIFTLFFSIVLSSLIFAGICLANFNFSQNQNFNIYAEENINVDDNFDNNLTSVENDDSMVYWNSPSNVSNVDISSGQDQAISSAEDLAEMMRKINNSDGDTVRKTFYLTCDIDLSGKIWTPIKSFNNGAVFDGRGYTISGLNINDTIVSDYVGLFGKVSGGATIKNLILESVNIVQNNNPTGGIVGFLEGGQIINCGITGSIVTSGTKGGLVGLARDGATIKNCFSYASISGGSEMGGIVGYIGYIRSQSSVFIENCFYYGNSNIAGIIGLAEDYSDEKTIISNVYTNGQSIYVGDGVELQGYADTKMPSSKPNDEWVYDSAGVMHGKSGYVLKGVGNISITYGNNVYLHNIMTQESSGAIEFSSATNQVFKSVSVTRFGVGVIGLATDDETFNAKMENIYDNYDDISTLNISQSSDSNISLSVSGRIYTFSFFNKLASNYVIETISIGQAREVEINLQKYINLENFNKGHLNGEVNSKIVLSDGGNYLNDTLDFGTSSSYSFYIPHGANFTITFSNNFNEYLKSINAILVNENIRLNLSGDTVNYTSTSITSNTDYNCFFDNTQTLTIDLNQDGYLNFLNENAPMFKVDQGNNQINYVSNSITLTVLVYENLSDCGFRYNNKFYGKFSANSSILYPVWAKYVVNNIKNKNNDSILSQENTLYGGDLYLKDSIWDAKRGESEKREFRVIWGSVDERIVINQNNGGNQNAEPISTYISEFKFNDKIENLTSNLTTNTAESQSITLRVNAGFYLGNMYLVVNENSIVNIDVQNEYEYEYYYNYQADTIDGRKINGKLTIVHEQDGSYMLNFDHLIGVREIGFEFKANTYEVKFNTNIDSSIEIYNNSPIKINGADINSKNNTYTVDFDFKSTKDFVLEVKTGYSFSQLNYSDIKAYNSVGQEVDLSFSPFTIQNNGEKFTLTFENVTIDVDRFEIILNVQKNLGTFNFELSGINEDLLSSQYMPDLQFYVKKNDIRNDSSVQNNKVTVNVNTDDVIQLFVTGLPDWVYVEGINVDDGFNGIIEENLQATDGRILSLSQYYYNNGFNENIVVQLKLRSSQVNIIEEIQARQTQQIKNEYLQNDYSYGTIVFISKTNNELILNVQDYNDEEKQEVYKFFTYDLNMAETYAVREINVFINDNKIGSININNFDNENVNIQMTLTSDDIKKGVQIKIVKVYKNAGLHIYNAFSKNGSNVVSYIQPSNSYEINGQTYSDIYYGETLSMVDQTIKGYKFLGYYYSAIDLNTSFSFDINNLQKYGDDILKDKLLPENIFVYAIYEAKIFTISFQKDFNDSVINNEIITELSHSNSISIEFNTNSLIGGDLPIALNCGMYNFGGWSINDNKYISYVDSVWGEIPTFDSSWNFDDELNIVNLTIKVVAKIVNYSLYDGDQLIGLGIVTYGDSNYSNKNTNISKWGYTFGGWQYLNNNIVYIDGSGVGAIFDIQSDNVVFYAKWLANEMEVNFVTKVGKFSLSNQTTIKVSVVYGTNKYISEELFDESGNIKDIPVWEVEGITFRFTYFTLEGDSNAIVYSANDLRNYTYVTKTTTFVANYEIVDITREVNVTDEAYEWTYDATNHYLSLPLNYEYASYTYQWQKLNNNGDFQNILGANDLNFAIKNVSDSGVYRCIINATAKNVYASGVLLDVASNEIEITINKKVLTFVQDGVETNNITKVFDNTNKSPINLSFTGVVGGENILMTATYAQINVGTNIPMNITISSTDANVLTNNYTYNNVVGTINKYVIEYVVSGEIFKVGSVSKRILIKENFYSYNLETQQFLQRNGFSPTIELYTSKNEIGSYSYNSSNDFKILAENFNVINGLNNFDFNIVGTFIIKDSTYGISVNVLAKCDDLNNDKIADSSISSITVSPEFTSMSDNNTNDVSIVETQEYFEQFPNIEIKVNFNNPYYWVDYWVVKIDGNVVSNLFEAQDEIVYNVVDLTAKQIEITVYVTTLKEIIFDYNLVLGETLENVITSTKFAYQQTVQYSIDNYGAVLPITNRVGWVFTGWTLNNNVITTETVWAYQDSVLRASWEIADLQVESINEVLEFTYDGLEHSKSINLLNKNEVSLQYSYVWTTNASEKGTYNNETLTVKNVLQSGKYSLRISAIYNGVAKSILCTVNVVVTPFSIFNEKTTINKEYDTTNTASVLSYSGANGEKVDIFGQYDGVDAGSLINISDTSVWYLKVYLNNELQKDSSNYKINFSNIDQESQILKRNITIDIGYSSKIYDGTKLTFSGSYNQVTPFTYVVSTNDVECKLYSGEDLLIEISGDKINNFDIIVNGSMEIIRKSIQFPIEWSGELTLTFDGQYHSVLPKLESDIVITSIRYKSETYEEIYNSIESNKGVKYAGTYSVVVTLQENDHYDNIQDISTTLIIKPKTIYVSYASGENNYTKVYDGTMQVLSELNLVAWEKLNTTMLSTIIPETSDMPTFNYVFENATACEDGQTKNIIVVLDEDNQINNNYILNQGTVKGVIEKRQTNIYVNATKEYDGETDFVVNANNNDIVQITGSNIVDGEEISGSLTFKNITSVGIYNNLSDLQKIISLNIGAFNYNTNYVLNFVNSDESGKINNIDNKIEIIKAKIFVGTINNEEYVYTGEAIEVNYAISRIDGNISAKVPTALVITFNIVGIGAIDGNGNVVQVGNYNFTYALNEEDSQSFEIVNSGDKVAFSVIKRDLLIKFEKVIDYSYTDDEGGTYSSSRYPNDNIIAPGYSLGYGDNIEWNFTTNGNISKVYYLVNDQDFLEKVVVIRKNGNNYTQNYNIIYDITASVIISRPTIDVSKIQVNNSIVEYDGNKKTISISIMDGDIAVETITFGETNNGSIYNVKRLNDAGEVDIVSPDDVFYAGVYSFDYEFNNYAVKNYKKLTLTITPRIVRGYIDNTNKIYDGTDYVLTNYEINGNTQKNVYAVYYKDGIETNENAFLQDDITIVAKYEDKNVGANKKITFELQSSNLLILCSYKLDSVNTSNYVGEIQQKQLMFTLKDVYYSYYTNKSVLIDVNNFTVDTMAVNEILRGQIIINKTQVGAYNLSELVSNDDVTFSLACYTFDGEPTNINNYTFSVKSLNGNLVIDKAHIVVSISDSTKIYNGEEQTPTFKYSVYENKGEIVSTNFDVSQKYFLGDVNPQENGDSTINIGEYSIFIYTPSNSNYILVNEDGNAINQYTSSVKFNIVKRQISINVKDKVIYLQDGNNATYDVLRTDVIDPNDNGQNGLLDFHTFSATLNTNNNKIGTYTIVNLSSSNANLTTNPIYVTNLNIVENGTNIDVLNNYEIVSYTATIIIVGDLQSVDISNITNLTYSASNKVEDDNFKIKFIFNNEEYEIKYNQSINFGASNNDGIKEFTATLNNLMVYGETSENEFDFIPTENAIDVGTYKIVLQIINNFDNSSIMANKELQFVINKKEITTLNGTFNKYYDRTSDVIGEITSSDIFDIDKSNVKINGVYVKDENPTAVVGVHTIRFSLSGEKSFNYVLNVPEKIGQISKLGVELVLKNSYETYYTEKDIQIDISNFKAINSQNGNEIDDFVSRLSGYVVINAKQSSSYELKDLFVENQITPTILDSTGLLDNYSISSYSGLLVVNPCEIVVDITNNEVIYNGRGQSIQYNVDVYSGHGALSTNVKGELIDVLYDEDEILKINAGSYTVTIKISDSYINNYVLINNGNKVSQYIDNEKFVINKRNIVVGISEPYSKMFTGNVVEYNLTVNNIFDDGNANSGLVNGQTISGKFVTNNSIIGEYTFQEESSLKIVFDTQNFFVFSNATDVTSNYNIVNVFGTIIITAETIGKIDTEHINSLIYNAHDYIKTNDIYVNVFINGEFVKFIYGVENEYGELNSLMYNNKTVTSAINAGSYTVQLTSKRTDIFPSQEINFSIGKKSITNLIFTSNKVYDKTSSVIDDITSPDICYNELGVIDDVVISGVYVEAGTPTMSVGTHEIIFTLSGASSSNYQINTGTLSGTIYAKQIKLQLKDKLVSYYTGDEIVVLKDNIDAFDVNGLSDEEFLNRITGSITINLYNSGEYSLENYANNITLAFADVVGNEGFLNNYQIIGLFGTLTIQKAQIKVEISNYDKIYNGLSQYPDFEVEIFNGNGLILEENKTKILSVSYNLQNSDVMLTSPVNSGIYQINITINENFINNYELIDDNDNICDDYTALNTLNINKRQIKIVANPNPEPYIYNGNNAVYEIKNSDVIGINADGLVSLHTISGTFTTNSELCGVYELNEVNYSSDFSVLDITPIISIYNNSIDVTANYEIISVTIKMEIVSSLGDDFDTSKLNNLVYDNTDKIANGQIQVGLQINGQMRIFTFGEQSNICTFSELKFNNENTSSVVNAGEYSFKILINTGDNTKEQVITFNVAKKIINYVSLEKYKEYDGTSSVLGEINSDQIYSDDDVVLIGHYYNSGSYTSDVGKHEIVLDMQGVDISNYDLQVPAISGQILPRNIQLQIKDGIEYVYSAENPIIVADDLEVVSGELVKDHTMKGNIVFLQTSIGEYTFEIVMLNIEQFKILDNNGIDVNSNYNITYSGTIKIVAVEINVTINEDLNFVYNGQRVDINDYIQLNNIPQSLQEEAMKNIVIEYNAIPLNAGNYTATVYSNSLNFVVTIEGQSDNVINFVIQKRDISIDIGDIEVYYNPLSNYLTNLSNADVINIVENQNISGTFSLQEIGCAVDKYEIEDILFENVKILVNDEDILPINYNITSYDGSITVLPFVIEAGNMYLENDSFVYSGNNVVNLLSVIFVDANGVSQKITANDSTWGEISVESNEAINVGTYVLNVEIYNCEIPTNTLNFEITQREITSILFKNNKEYDGNSFVLNQDNNTNLYSPNIVYGDTLVINGFYVDSNGDKTSNVGSYSLKFEIQNYDQFPQKNYVINYNSVGQITKASLQLSVDNLKIVYSTTGQYLIESSNITITDGTLKSDDYLTGNIYILKPSYVGLVNSYELNTTQIKVLNALNNDVSFNYLITFDGSVEIIKAQISLSFEDVLSEYIYSNEQINILPNVQLINSNEEIIPEIVVTYSSQDYNSNNAPKNVGEYIATFNVNNQCYEIIGENTFEFNIIPYDLILRMGDIPNNIFFKLYGESDPRLLSYVITTIFNDNVNIEFTREPGEDVGAYDIFVNYWDNQNYNVSFESGANADLFTIKKASTLVVNIVNSQENIDKLSKIYDNSYIEDVDISTLEYNANGVIVTGYLQFARGVNVGQYPLMSWNLQSDSHEDFVVQCELKFTIKQKEIKLSANNYDKPYDASTMFIGDISILDLNNNVLDSNVYKLVAKGDYQNSNVGNDIPILITFQGDNISNYIVTNSLSGTISKRNVTIIPTADQTIIYGTTQFNINYQIQDDEVTTFFGDFQNEIEGDLYIDYLDGKTKFVAGIYVVKSNLSSNNLNLNFVDDVNFVIERKELIVTTNQGFIKTYDGNANVIGQLLLEGVIETDDVSVQGVYYNNDLSQIDPSVSDDKIVVFTLSGDDAENYFANNVMGAITEKMVTIFYNYLPNTIDVINPDRLQNSGLTESKLIYGAKVSQSTMLPIPKHEGYNFVGWFLDDNFTTELSNDTIINDLIWNIDEESKIVYAKWEIKTFDISIILSTKVNGIFVTDTDSQGGYFLNDISGQYNYYDNISLDSVVEAKNGYEFMGFSLDINLKPDDNLLTNGLRVDAQNYVVYAKFQPLMVTLILNANGGNFEVCDKWEFNSTNTTATLQVEFNSSLEGYATIPVAYQSGYTQNKNTWLDENDEEISFDVNTIIGDLFYPTKLLYVNWIAGEYELILDANGGRFENFNTDVWNVIEQDQVGNVTKISKYVYYGNPIGEIVEPIRDGWDFGGWSIADLSESYIWQQTETTTANATWNEKDFNLTINSEFGFISVNVYDKQGSLIENINTSTSGTSQIVVDVKNTYTVDVVLTEKVGYLFKNWESDIQSVNGITEKSLTINGFSDNQEITAIFEAKDNLITLKVNDDKKGNLSYQSYTTSGNGIVEFYSKSGSIIDLIATANEGYEILGWDIDAGEYTFNISNTDKDSLRTLSNFVSDVTITVNFTERTNAITISCKAEEGTISVENEIDGVNSYVLQVKTDNIAKFTIVANHGYKVNFDISYWRFETTSNNKGSFEISGNEYVCVVSFTGFTSDGTIIVPFIKEEYTVNVVSVLKDDNLNIDLTASGIVSVFDGESTILLNSNQSFTGLYKTTVILTPNNVINGYQFKLWSVRGDKEQLLTSNDGLVNQLEDGQIEFSVLNDITLYLIYEIKTFDIDYEVNDSLKGSLSFNDLSMLTKFSQKIKFGYDALSVTAVSDEHYRFVKWVQDENGEQLDYSDSATITVENVNSDMKFIAIFEGVPIELTINVTLPLSELFDDIDIDFGDIVINETENTKIKSFSKNERTFTYVVSTITGENVEFSIVNKNGYEFDTLKIDPRLNYTMIDNSILLKNVFISSTIDISMKAEINEVIFRLNDAIQGAEIYEYSNKNKGVVRTEYVESDKAIKLYVKTGGNAYAIVYTYNGYKLIANSYFATPTIVQNNNQITSYAIGGFDNVQSDMEIGVVIETLKYKVTFDFNYENSPNSVESVVEFLTSNFNPQLDSTITAPDRYQYNLVGWNTRMNGSGVNYQFDSNGIYTIEYLDGVAYKKYGFVGGENNIQASSTDYDFECVLYANWELQKYAVNLVFVPNFAVDNSQIAYQDVFPEIEGRYITYSNSATQTIESVSYVPGYNVKIIAPAGYSGFNYFGWSYEADITDRALLNTNEFNVVMGEEAITVYLYYTMDIQVSVIGGGDASVSKNNALYGEIVNINATSGVGYTFSCWLKNGSIISNSEPFMEQVVTQPTIFQAKFIGDIVSVIVEQTDNVKLTIKGSTSEESGVYRVGDTIIFEVSNLTEGYYRKGWIGEFSGQILSDTYTILPQDSSRGYVKFKLNIQPSTIYIQYIVSSGVGGVFVIDETETINITKSYLYDSTAIFNIKTTQRYTLSALTVNGIDIDLKTTSLIVNIKNAININKTNVIEAKFEQLLWIDNWEMFSGMGTESDPYVIASEKQLSAMAYLINNNIDANGKIPYAKGYYVVKKHMNLQERFWQPIGTKENPFDGTFNLQDYVVSELLLDKEYEVTYLDGLFGYITENAKFITTPQDYTLAITIVSSIIGLIVFLIILICVIIIIKRKRFEKLSSVQFVEQNSNEKHE